MTRYVFAALGCAVVLFRRQLFDRLAGLSPTQPSEPGDDDREASGADPEYGDDLEAMKLQEKELDAIAEEHGLNLLVKAERAIAEDVYALRLSIAERVDHFHLDRLGHLDDWLDRWVGDPSWREEKPVTVLPDFRTVHALIDPTGEFAVVTA